MLSMSWVTWSSYASCIPRKVTLQDTRTSRKKFRNPPYRVFCSISVTFCGYWVLTDHGNSKNEIICERNGPWIHHFPQSDEFKENSKAEWLFLLVNCFNLLMNLILCNLAWSRRCIIHKYIANLECVNFQMSLFYLWNYIVASSTIWSNY